MSETKFTPGPWKINSAAPSDPAVYTMYSRQLVAGCYVHERISQVEEMANAHLIAAAPEMYEELDELEGYFADRADADCDQDGYIQNEEMRILSRIQLLLAKARGEE